MPLNRRTIALFILVSFSLILIALLVSVLPAFTTSASASALKQSGLPSQGWRVCEDLGIGTVPGVGQDRQRFRLCRGDDWIINTFCINPGETPPTVGAFCSMVSPDTFWCGDGVQQVQLFQIIQTPLPTSTPTRTFTPLPTLTPTNTPVTPTITSTPPGITPFANDTPTPTTPVVTHSPTQTRTRTPVTPAPYRPKPGGPGNLGYVLAGAFSGLTFLILAAVGLRLWAGRRS